MNIMILYITKITSDFDKRRVTPCARRNIIIYYNIHLRRGISNVLYYIILCIRGYKTQR